MRPFSALVGVSALLLTAACGSSDPTGNGKPSSPSGNGGDQPHENQVNQAGAFPAATEGYQRFETTTVKNVAPGSDVTYCQYVMAPADHDMDIIDVRGYQSELGHHAVAFSFHATADTMIGDSFKCMGTEFSSGDGTEDSSSSDSGLANMGSFLGAAGNQSGSKLPDGVAFRLKAGDGIMLNVHYLNTTTKPLDGRSAVDVKFADADPDRLIASLFVNLNVGFELPSNAKAESSVQCVAGDDVSIIMMGNHMHEFGTGATTEVIAADGTNVMLHDDPTWTYEMQFNPDYTRWTAEEPFVLHTGDTIRTTCRWNNTKPEMMKFPREMCLGTGFALTKGGSTQVPACAAGTWLSKFL